LTLGIHADDKFSEVTSFQHADECFRRFLQTVDDVLTIVVVIAAALGRAGQSLPLHCLPPEDKLSARPADIQKPKQPKLY
jgi:hypothetical protein